MKRHGSVSQPLQKEAEEIRDEDNSKKITFFSKRGTEKDEYTMLYACTRKETFYREKKEEWKSNRVYYEHVGR